MAAVDDLQRMIADAERIVAFTGAGISTESGIPDFRSPGGIWTKYKGAVRS
jgi:NAD-dependent deacetylase